MLKGHSAQVVDLTFSADDSQLSSSAYDGDTRVWDPINANLVAQFERHNGARFSQDGRWLVLEAAGHNVSRLELANSLACRVYPLPSGSNFSVSSTVGDVALSSDSTWLAATDSSLGTTLWHVPTGRLAARLPEHTFITAFSPDGSLLYASGQGIVNRWSMKTDATADPTSLRLEDASSLQAIPGASHTFCLSPDGTRMSLRLGLAETVMLEPAHDNRRQLFSRRDDWMYQPVVRPDGRWLACGPRHTSVACVWNADTKEIAARLTEPFRSQTAVAFSPDSRWQVVCEHGEFVFYNVNTWDVDFRIDRQEFGVGNIAFSPDMRLMALTELSTVRLFDVATRTQLATLTGPRNADVSTSHMFGACDLCFSTDGTRLAVGTRQNSVEVWNLRLLQAGLKELGLGW